MFDWCLLQYWWFANSTQLQLCKIAKKHAANYSYTGDGVGGRSTPNKARENTNDDQEVDKSMLDCMV